MAVQQVPQQLPDQLLLVRALQDEGVLDSQFTELMMLQDEGNPDFVAEVIHLFWEDSGTKIERIGTILSSGMATGMPDWAELDGLVHQFKGSSASLGARTIAQLCVKLREECQLQDLQACTQLQHDIMQAYLVLQAKLGGWLQLEAQRRALRS